MSIDEQPVALPKLYGAPAYARPQIPVPQAPRPFDPDQMPLQVYQTEEQRRYAAHLVAHAYGSAGDGTGDPRDHANRGARTKRGARGALRPRSFSLRSIAGRLLGGD